MIGSGCSRALPRNTGRSRLAAGLAVILAAGALIFSPRAANAQPVFLGQATDCVVVAGSAITGTKNASFFGNLALSPGSSVVGLDEMAMQRVHIRDAMATQARADAGIAYNALSAKGPEILIPSELGGTIRGPGVYRATGNTFTMTGTLTLDAQGNPDAVFIFKTARLTTARVANIDLIRGAQASHVFWQVTDFAGLGPLSTFRGSILARNTIGVAQGATLRGRAISLEGVVSVEGTTLTPATLLLLPADPSTVPSLTSSSTRTAPGEPVTFTATVRGGLDPAVPNGPVVFKDGATVIGTDQQNYVGPASITTSSLSVGSHSITAVYLSGNTLFNENVIRFAPSTSPALLHVVTPAGALMRALSGHRRELS
ncbi:ice-binding family protein [Streptosporangium subroseum]|uniref:ice-binding family protein n=1 Tax=Streptosporangium subroseum TaxID=106412 RepID=UPI003416FC4A